MELDTHELAWAAGFFDGEGTVYVHKNSGYGHLSVKVGQGDIRPLQRFSAAVRSLGRIAGPYPTANGNPFWEYVAGKFEHAQQVLVLLWPYLSAPRREQAAAAYKAMRETYWSKGKCIRPKGYGKHRAVAA